MPRLRIRSEFPNQNFYAVQINMACHDSNWHYHDQKQLTPITDITSIYGTYITSNTYRHVRVSAGSG